MIFLALITALGITVWLIMKNAKSSDAYAKIYSEGKLIHTLCLSEDTQLTVTCGSGYNIITIQGNSISVTDANCPDKVCIHTGKISGSGIPIICLPNRLEIKVISGNNDIDAQIR